MSIDFSIDNQSKDRVEYWRGVLSEELVPMEFCPVGGRARGWGRLRSVAALKAFEFRSSACVVSGGRPAAERHGSEYGKAELVLEGRLVVNQDGRQAVLGPGDLTVHDASRPFEMITADDVRVVGVLFPLRMISIPETVLRDLTARRVNDHSMSATLLASFLTVLSSRFDGVLPQEEAGISSAAGGLLTAVLAQLVEGCVAMGPESRRSMLVRTIQCFLEAEIADPDLNPAAVAAAHNISLRQLHRMFEHEDLTVTELIRARRLEGCRRDLADPALRAQSIGAIATRWGIPDSAKFSRMFRAAYGVSPREYRHGVD